MKSKILDLIRLANELGASDSEIAKVTGYNASYIGVLRRKAGIESKYHPPKTDDTRINLVIDRLHAGETLQEIGDSLLITRERVRQIAAKRGVTAKVSQARRREFSAQTKLEQEAARLRAREERYQSAYGCSYAEVIDLNGGLPLTHPDSRSQNYRLWVRNAVVRMRSDVKLTLPQWAAAWGEHWEERGRGRNYRLSRIDRNKGFTPDNVICERGDEAMSRHRKLNPWLTGGFSHV